MKSPGAVSAKYICSFYHTFIYGSLWSVVILWYFRLLVWSKVLCDSYLWSKHFFKGCTIAEMDGSFLLLCFLNNSWQPISLFRVNLSRGRKDGRMQIFESLSLMGDHSKLHWPCSNLRKWRRGHRAPPCNQCSSDNIAFFINQLFPFILIAKNISCGC